MASTTIEKIKAWATPLLFSTVTYLLWQDISEMKSDVKKLLSESEYKRAIIETLKEDVNQLKQSVYYNKKTASLIKNRTDIYFINEEIYRLRKKVKVLI
jgi:type II secretory pathway component PulM